MLKNEDLVRVVKEFEDRPIYVKLINQLWPHVKDFDFEREKFLQIRECQDTSNSAKIYQCLENTGIVLRKAFGVIVYGA